MSVYHPSFNFLNKNSYDDYNLIVAHFDGDQGESDTNLGMDPIYSESADGTKRYDYGAKFNSVATPKITVIKSNGTDFTTSEVRQFLKWTTGSRKNSYLELCEWSESNNKWEPKFRLLGRTTAAYQQKLDARTVGLIIEFTTVSPFAYSPVQTVEATLNGVAKVIATPHESDDYDTPICLDVEFTHTGASGGSLTITNNLMSQPTKISGLLMNETVTLDSNGFITSNSNRVFGNNFNYVFPKIGYTEDMQKIESLTVTGNGKITLKYIYFIKIGDCTIDVDVSGGGISCVNPGSGGGGGGIVVEELDWDNITGKPELYTADQIDAKFAVLESQISDLLYKEIAIISLSNNVVTAEKGSTVTSVKLSWAVNKTPTVLKLDGTGLSTLLTTYTYNNLNLTSNKTWTLYVEDERQNSDSASTSVSFLNGVYYGVATIPSVYNSDFILSLTKRLSNSKVPSFTVTTGARQYIYYCLPKSMGTCLFTVGGFTGGFTLVDTIQFVNQYGHSEQYYIYRSDNPNLGTKQVFVS